MATRPALVVAPLLLVPALAACGSEAAPEPEAAASSEIQDVVSLDAVLTDSLVAIGAPVTASLPSFGEEDLSWPFTEEEAQRITVLSGGDSYIPNLEELAAVPSDLIVTLTWAQEDFGGALSEMAPVVALEDTFPWRENTVRLAEEIHGSPERAEQVLEDFDEEVERVADTLPTGTTVALLRVRPDGGLQTYHSSSAPGALLEQLGLGVTPFPAGADDPNGDQSVATLSPELLGSIPADVLFVLSTEPEQGVPSGLTDSPLWANLPVVQAGDVHVVSTAGWTTNGPLGWQRGLLTDVEQLLGDDAG